VFKRIWTDPVASQVIAGIILAMLAVGRAVYRENFMKPYPVPLWAIFLIAFVFVRTWSLFVRKRKPKISVQSVVATDPPSGVQLTYPVKLYVTCRNDSKFAIDVRMLEYKPKLVQHRQFVPGVVQILIGQAWLPSDHGVERIAVLPGQLFKAWIGVDERQCDAVKVNGLKGRIGTLVLSVNDRPIPFEL
jgi:hypothetical protein